MMHNDTSRHLAGVLGDPNQQQADSGGSGREGTRRFLCEVLDLTSLCILDHGGDDPVFTCLVNGVRLPPVSIEILTNRNALALVIAKPTRHLIPYFTPAEWAQVARALLLVAEHVDADSADEVELRLMLESFLSAHGQVVLDWDDREDQRRAVIERIAGFVACNDRRVFVRLAEFHAHCRDEHDFEHSSIELRRRLDRLGFAKPNGHGKTCLRVDGVQFQGRYFSSPPGFVSTAEEG